MVKPELSIIIPCHNEARFLSNCLPPIIQGIGNLGICTTTEVVVVASACTDETGVLSKAIFEEHCFPGRVVSCDERGKNLALNCGLEHTQAGVVVCIDGDTIITPDSLKITLDTIYKVGVRLVGGMCQPKYTSDELNTNEAVTLETLKYARRLAGTPHRLISGCFMMFDRLAIREFPQKRVPDDAWLNGYIGSLYGIEAIEVVEETVSLYVPPRTLEEFMRQNIRYQGNRFIVRSSYPEFEEYFQELEKHFQVRDSGIEQRWKVHCEALGVDDFEYWRLALRQRLDEASARAVEVKEQDLSIWDPLATTKYL